MDNKFLLDYADLQINVPWGYIVGRWYGNRDVRPILALHGWLDNLGTWDRLIPLLPRHLGILCIDFPGHGRSTMYPKGITYYDINYVYIIKRIMEEYNWKKVSLMGHSMGAMVAITYTTLFPHTVDMLIEIDFLLNPRRSPGHQIKQMRDGFEKLLIENERLDLLTKTEPPLYSYGELEEILYKGSRKSLEKENCKYLLNRNIKQSNKFPAKYYISRDGRCKYLYELNLPHGLAVEMTKRITNVNHLVIKATKSKYINHNASDCIKILQQDNPNFKLCEIEGTHFVHLNNPYEVAEEVVPFILKYRPAILNTWTVGDENEENITKRNRKNKKSKL